VDGQQLMQDARVHQETPRMKSPCLNMAARWWMRHTEELYRFMKPVCAERMCRTRQQGCMTSVSEHVEGVNADFGRTLVHRTRTLTVPDAAPGDPAFYDILHAYMGYRTWLLSQRFPGGSRWQCIARRRFDAYKRCPIISMRRLT